MVYVGPRALVIALTLPTQGWWSIFEVPGDFLEFLHEQSAVPLTKTVEICNVA